ncbi:MAG: lysylphosphatidylglycerol synthase transmembrane domain-containing protein [Actinomycetota bacterium]
MHDPSQPVVVNERSSASSPPKWRRPLSIALSLAIVVGVFVFAIPKIADYGAVIDTLRRLTWIELSSLVLATTFNLFTYWLANMAAVPGLSLGRAALLTQSTTSVANTLPAGGAIAVGLTYEMLRSWRFTATAATLYVAVTGIWNIFLKLALPVVSVALLALTGQGSAAFVTAALIGLAVLAAAVGVLTAIFWKEELAHSVGELGGRVAAFVTRLFRRPPPQGFGDRAVRFRRETVGLVRRRWVALTVTTIVSHLALFVVLLFSLRHVDASAAEISTVQVLAVFAFGRLISALPVTPGGLGVIELGYIGGLVAAGGQQAEVVAAVLLFRLLTYGVQIPVGAVTYLIWRRGTSAGRSGRPSRSAVQV